MSKTKTADLMLGDVATLEELLDRESLVEVCRSFHDIFGLSIRIFSRSGSLLADIHQERLVCRYVNATVQGRIACVNIVSEIQKRLPEKDSYYHQCFTGAIYDIIPIWYNDRQLGRIVLGPFFSAGLKDVPDTLLKMVAEENQQSIKEALDDIPVVRIATAERISAHFRNILDLLLFSGHRSQLMSEMHLASVRESYRELAERNASLQEAFDRLKELDRLKSNFLATISHELRTPLTSIIGYSEMLLSDIVGKLNEEQYSFTETIHNKGQLLLTLITNLLDQSQLEQEHVTLNIRNIDPKEILNEVVETLIPDAMKKNIRVEYSCPQDIHYMNADPMRLKQILLNLGSNAVKFTAADGVITLTVRSIEITPENGQLDDVGAAVMMVSERGIEFEVRDTGIGFASDQLDHIFDAFYQVDGSSTREYGGIGLGLSIVKKLVDAHGGKIVIESQIGEGTVFFVRLPEQPPQSHYGIKSV